MNPSAEGTADDLVWIYQHAEEDGVRSRGMNPPAPFLSYPGFPFSCASSHSFLSSPPP